MLPNAFINRAEPPTDRDLAAALGPAKTLWDQLLSQLRDEHQIDKQEWNSYSRKAGWSLRAKRRERNIFYLSPCQGCFRASFALGDKAIQVVRKSALPKPVLKIVETAKKYAEGTAVRIDVKTVKDVAVVKILAGIKLEN